MNYTEVVIKVFEASESRTEFSDGRGEGQRPWDIQVLREVLWGIISHGNFSAESNETNERSIGLGVEIKVRPWALKLFLKSDNSHGNFS